MPSDRELLYSKMEELGHKPGLLSGECRNNTKVLRCKCKDCGTMLVLFWDKEEIFERNKSGHREAKLRCGEHIIKDIIC